MFRTTQLLLDRMAIGISIVCALHCAVLPFALVLLPVLASFPLEDERFHQAMLWFIIPSSGTALMLGCRRHKDRLALAAGGLGLLVLVSAAIMGHDLLGHLGERLVTLIGAVILSWGHWRNYALCRGGACDHGPEE